MRAMSSESIHSFMLRLSIDNLIHSSNKYAGHRARTNRSRSRCGRDESSLFLILPSFSSQKMFVRRPRDLCAGGARADGRQSHDLSQRLLYRQAASPQRQWCLRDAIRLGGARHAPVLSVSTGVEIAYSDTDLLSQISIISKIAYSDTNLFIN